MEPITKQQIDQALQRLVKDRSDEDAWKALFTGAWATGIATAHHVLRGQLDLARDVTQEAFHRIVRYCDFGRIENAEAFLGYLRTVCSNLSKDAYRRLTLDVEEELGEIESPDLSIGTPEELVATEELKQKLLSSLNEADQLLFELVLAGYPLNEIASRMSITYSNAGVRLHRLRNILSKFMKQKDL
jgi:RNA polymerase sigma factor (sigma-70 family)